MKVENARLPSLRNLLTNGVLHNPVQVVMKAPGVVGKFGPPMLPVRYAFPKLSTAMARPVSKPLLPMYVEYRMAFPAAFNLVIKTFVVPLFVD